MKIQQKKAVTKSASGKPATKKTVARTATKKKPATKSTSERVVITVDIKDHKDKNGGHPHVIIDNVDNKHVSVGFTTKKKKGQSKKAGKNFTLENNPLGGSDESYMRRQGTVATQESYYKPRQGQMTPNDHERAKKYADKAKQKYLEKKNKKK